MENNNEGDAVVGMIMMNDDSVPARITTPRRKAEHSVVTAGEVNLKHMHAANKEHQSSNSVDI